MSVTSDLLFAYLRDVFYGTPDTKLEIDKLDEDFSLFAKGLTYFARCFTQYNDFANALARGDLSVTPPPPENELAAPLKSLYTNLRRLTWQSKQVAMGDYKQRVDFMGEFADAFNTMVEQLADRQKMLEDEIIVSQKHAKALEQSNLLLSRLTHYIPQQIFVIALNSHEVLLINEMGIYEVDKDPDYVNKLMRLLPFHHNKAGSYYTEVLIDQKDTERYLAINYYFVQWGKVSAVALIANDISAEKRQLRELENYAYHDSLTHVFNRFYGMLTLSEWVDARRRFALFFIDLDNLKYVNDRHGHSEGDEYIIRVSKHLCKVSDDTVVCRLGGDEFMMLIPEIDKNEAQRLIETVSTEIENDEYLDGKDYSYGISVGIVAVDENNDLPFSSVLSMADERMYENKRTRKKERRYQNEHREWWGF